MNAKYRLLSNIDKVHTTPMGVARISKNLLLGDADAVDHCKKIITNSECKVSIRGKNYYCEYDGVRITINIHSYTIITAHKK